MKMSKRIFSLVITIAAVIVMVVPAHMTAQGEKDASPSLTSGQKYLFDIFKDRRSVRNFKSTPIPQEHILKILDIARTAPTAGNQQPWKFLVIQDRTKLNQLKQECMSSTLEAVKGRGNVDEAKLNSLRQRLTKSLDGYLSAPVYVAVLVDTKSKYPTYNLYDGTLAAGYLMIAARSFGYGTVFITDSIPYRLLKKVFDIPDRYVGICFTPIGVPDKWPESPPKRTLDEFVVFEKFVKSDE
jgi:nitroreductase